MQTNMNTLHRLLGVDKLFSYAISEWLSDIKKNQLPGILGGVGPMHSLVQLGKFIILKLWVIQPFVYEYVDWILPMFYW